MSKGQRARRTGRHNVYRAPAPLPAVQVYARDAVYDQGPTCPEHVWDERDAEHWCCERAGHRGMCLSPEGLAWDAGDPSITYRLEPTP